MSFEQFLRDKNLIDDRQLAEALRVREEFGGSTGDILRRLGYIESPTLLQAASDFTGINSIDITSLSIEKSVLGKMSASDAWNLRVLPFEFDSQNNCLKLACKFPLEASIKDQLSHLMGDMKVEIYFADDRALDAAILNHYRHEMVATNNDGNSLTASSPDSRPKTSEEQSTRCQIAKSYLFLTPYRTADQLLCKALSREGAEITVVDSLDEAEQLICEHKYDYFLIREQFSQNQEKVIELCNTRLPDCIIIEYGSIDQLIDKNLSKTGILSLGTHGSLSDLNTIDLLQIMKSNDKTVRVDISANGRQLTMFIDRGNLIYAECGQWLGAGAVFRGLLWNRGIWNIDTVSTDTFPPPNVNRSIDSILIEGCYLIDEQNKPSVELQGSKDN